MGDERLSRRALFGRLRARAASAAMETAADTLDAVVPEPTPRLVLHRDRCFTFRGPECGACIGFCPEDAEGALRLRACKPVIDYDLCSGCGACVAGCPTIPRALEIVMPRRE